MYQNFHETDLPKKQYINATTSQFYGLIYYGSQVTPMYLVKKLKSVHYRVLRIAAKDWKTKEKKRRT